MENFLQLSNLFYFLVEGHGLEPDPWSTTLNKNYKAETNSAILQTSVADPGCLSRIPDPTFFHPGSRIPDPNCLHSGPGSSSKNLSILTQKKTQINKFLLYTDKCYKSSILFTVQYSESRLSSFLIKFWAICTYVGEVKGAPTRFPKLFNDRILDPGFEFFHFGYGTRFRVEKIPDPGSASASKNLSIFKPKTVSKFSEKLSGMFIPDPDFFSIPGPWVKRCIIFFHWLSSLIDHNHSFSG